MGHDEHVDLSRRNLGALLGVFGAAALVGCVGDAGASSEHLGSNAEALNGPTFLWIDTIANLRSTAGSNDSSSSVAIAIVGGFAAWGDGGGGVFSWVVGALDDNGGTIIVPSGQSVGYWQRIYSGPLDVRWFGARPGDQSTNSPPTAFDIGASHYDYKVGADLSWTLATQSKCGDAIQRAIIAVVICPPKIGPIEAKKLTLSAPNREASCGRADSRKSRWLGSFVRATRFPLRSSRRDTA